MIKLSWKPEAGFFQGKCPLFSAVSPGFCVPSDDGARQKDNHRNMARRAGECVKYFRQVFRFIESNQSGSRGNYGCLPVKLYPCFDNGTSLPMISILQPYHDEWLDRKCIDFDSFPALIIPQFGQVESDDPLASGYRSSGRLVCVTEGTISVPEVVVLGIQQAIVGDKHLETVATGSDLYAK